MPSHVGRCAWCGTIDEFLAEFDRGTFVKRLKKTNGELSDYTVGHSHYKAWRDEFKHLRAELAKLGNEYRKLHIVIEYVIPGWPDKETGKVIYEKRPDVLIFSERRVLVLEFKQREPPPYDGFAKEVRGYLRLLEEWHPKVPRNTAKGALVLTKAVDFRKKYPRVVAISPDRVHVIVRKTFEESLASCADPEGWLSSIRTA